MINPITITANVLISCCTLRIPRAALRKPPLTSCIVCKILHVEATRKRQSSQVLSPGYYHRSVDTAESK